MGYLYLFLHAAAASDDLMCRVVMSVEDEEEESRRCYERYRILVQNECAGGEF